MLSLAYELFLFYKLYITAQKDNGCSVPVRAPEGVEGEATILVMLHEYLPDEDCLEGVFVQGHVYVRISRVTDPATQRRHK